MTLYLYNKIIAVNVFTSTELINYFLLTLMCNNFVILLIKEIVKGISLNLMFCIESVPTVGTYRNIPDCYINSFKSILFFLEVQAEP